MLSITGDTLDNWRCSGQVVQSTSTCREHLQLSKVLSVVESDICQTGSAILLKYSGVDFPTATSGSQTFDCLIIKIFFDGIKFASFETVLSGCSTSHILPRNKSELELQLSSTDPQDSFAACPCPCPCPYLDVVI